MDLQNGPWRSAAWAGSRRAVVLSVGATTVIDGILQRWIVHPAGVAHGRHEVDRYCNRGWPGCCRQGGDATMSSLRILLSFYTRPEVSRLKIKSISKLSSRKFPSEFHCRWSLRHLFLKYSFALCHHRCVYNLTCYFCNVNSFSIIFNY